jgi:hypothetical protein
MSGLDRFVLRDLPLPARLVIAAFLLSAGLGYVGALVQLHFQHAPPGQLLPGAREVTALYGAGDRPVSTIERLLESSEGPFNGAGSMRPAFTEQSRGWKELLAGKTPEQVRRLLEEREGERLALLHWARTGASREAYERDDFPLGEELAGQPISRDLLVEGGATGQPAAAPRVRIRSLIARRCIECHSATGRMHLARLHPLDSYDRVRAYYQVRAQAAMSPQKLAQTTHVHLLGFAVLYGLTGLTFSFTSYPRPLRAVGAVWPLALQVVEIGCWWLARVDLLFARAVVVLGPLVALGLAGQLLGSLWDLFDRRGKAIGVLLLAAGFLGGGALSARFVGAYLEREKSAPSDREIEARPAPS